MSAKVYCYIAEKPAVGKAIAEVLAKRSPIVERGQSFIRGVDFATAMSSFMPATATERVSWS